MESNTSQADTTNEQAGTEDTDVKADTKNHDSEPMRHRFHILGKDPESVRKMTDQLQKATDRLYDLERERLSLREWVLYRHETLGHLGHVPQKLQQRVFLLPHL